jgi:hypothetical protein
MKVVFPLLLWAGATGCSGGVDRGQCDAYLACSESLGQPTATLRATFGPDGVCWGEEAEELCRAQCEDAVTALSQAFPDNEVCAGAAGDDGIPDCASEIRATGTDVGDVIEDYETVDHTGANKSLYRYCDRAILVLSTTDWSPLNAQAIAELNSLRSEHPPRQLAIVVLVAADDLAAVSEFAVSNDAQVDVWYDPGFAWGERYDMNGGVPSYHLLRTGMELMRKDAGMPGNAELAEAMR